MAVKEKKRYVVVKCRDWKDVQQRVLSYFGERSYGSLNIKVVYQHNGFFIIRVANRFVHEFCGALLSFPISIKILSISGSIKKAKKALEGVFDV